MLVLKDVNLIRTNHNYQNTSLKGLVSAGLFSIFEYFIQKNITEYFLKNINLTIKNGEKIAILGKNGSGKSTLCKLIAKQFKPSSGLISNTFDIRLISEIESCFYKELTGRENLEFLANILYPNLTELKLKELITSCLDFSELQIYADRLVETYSLGMLSRLALSLITSLPQDFLILDEIYTHADMFFRKKLSTRFKNYLGEVSTYIIVSHYDEDVLVNCNRGIVMHKGQICFDGTIDKAIAVYKLLPESLVQ